MSPLKIPSHLLRSKSISRFFWILILSSLFVCARNCFPYDSPCEITTLLSEALEKPEKIIDLSKECPLSDPLARDLLMWIRIQKDPACFLTFEQASTLIKKHAHWPYVRRTQIRMEETLERQNIAPQKLINFFMLFPPVSFKGNVQYYLALLKAKQASTAVTHVRTYWHTTALTPGEQKIFLSYFHEFLTQKDHEKRLDTFLWREDKASIMPLLTSVSAHAKRTAETVLKFWGRKQDRSLTELKHLIKTKQPEVVIWACLKGLRFQKAYNEICQGFLLLPSSLSHPKAFHRLRILAAREALEMHKYRLAFDVLSRHGLPPGADRADAEWHTGWIALCFMKKPDLALKSFQSFEKNVRTPISLSRAGYWLGRTYKVLRDSKKASKKFSDAALYPTTFYGQLARYELNRSPFPSLLTKVQVTQTDRKAFEKNELVRAIRLLAPIGKPAHLLSVNFLCALAANSPTRGQKQLAAQLAAEVHPYIVVDLSRTLSIKDPLLPCLKSAYPLPVIPSHLTLHEKILTYSICYRESRFNPTALGDAGELGLMQIMPETAKMLAASLKFPHTPQKLLDPLYNMTLGSTYLRDLEEKYNHHFCLMLAAYNAGPGSVARWLENVGHPDNTVFGSVEKNQEYRIINWVEAIPYESTRDYVQRGMEAYVIYAGRLGKTADYARKVIFR